jgi:hypothetical protein
MKIKTAIKNYIFNKFKIWDIWDVLPYRCRIYYYDNIKPIFFPNNKKIRDSIPKTWSDITSLIVEVNFAMIKQFYDDEYMLGFVDWKSDEKHREFEQWLQKAYTYISYKRPSLEAKMNESYPPLKPLDEMFKPIVDQEGRKMFQFNDDGVPYSEKYKKVIEFEEKIKNTDTKILKKMIEYRDFFWT